jgi:hypothetical protein
VAVLEADGNVHVRLSQPSAGRRVRPGRHLLDRIGQRCRRSDWLVARLLRRFPRSSLLPGGALHSSRRLDRAHGADRGGRAGERVALGGRRRPLRLQPRRSLSIESLADDLGGRSKLLLRRPRAPLRRLPHPAPERRVGQRVQIIERDRWDDHIPRDVEHVPLLERVGIDPSKVARPGEQVEHGLGVRGDPRLVCRPLAPKRGQPVGDEEPARRVRVLL